ncbi:hypothetical protein H4219_001291 [Mycoemilia scoparia]|uniref:Pentatricopeptide repeat-containing protein n=1 Tax=Mycoemilia scoparia TaxID=417184 RepID=A0A9W8A6Z4_9FUNG|nr:hypothetical protein H4219_001291 [Mycoemilia scoparia]
MTFYDTLYQNFSKSTHLGEPKNRIARLGLEFKKSHQNGLIAILLSSNHLASINGSATAIAKIISENSPVATRQTKQNYNNQHSEIGPIENKIFAHPDNSKVIFESILALIRSGNIKSAKGLATGSYILFGKDVKVFNLFLRQYAESNDIVAIRNLMTEMSALKIPPDIYTWNTILSFYWKNKRPLSAKTLFALIIHYSEIDTQKSNNHTQPSFSILATDSLLDHWRKMLGARNIDKYIENLLNEWINDQDVRHLWTPNRATIAIMLKGLADKNTKDEIIHLTKVLRERDTLKTKILTGRHERLLINRLSFHDTNGDSPSTPISRNLMNQASQLYGPLHDLLKTSQNHHVAKKDMIDRRSEWHTALRNLIKNHSTHKEGIDDQTHDILAIIHTALDAMRCEGTWPTHATYVLLLNNLINIDDYTSAFALVETMIATDKLLLDNWTITAIIKGLSQQGPLALELLGNVASQNALDSTITPSHQMLLATLKTNALQNSLKKVCNTVEILAEKFGIYPNDESYRLIIDASLASNQKALVEKMLWNLEKQRLGLLV